MYVGCCKASKIRHLRADILHLRRVKAIVTLVRTLKFAGVIPLRAICADSSCATKNTRYFGQPISMPLCKMEAYKYAGGKRSPLYRLPDFGYGVSLSLVSGLFGVLGKAAWNRHTSSFRSCVQLGMSRLQQPCRAMPS